MAYKQDLLELFTDEHREAERLLAAYEATSDVRRRDALAGRLVTDLARHTVAEEHHLHPVVRRVLPDGEHLVARALADRAEAERVVGELSRRALGGPGAERCVRELSDWLGRHSAYQEDEVFPRLRDVLTRRERLERGTSAAAHAERPLDPGPGLFDRLRERLSARF